MANISRNTFDKLKHYVNVRMQQGVPLVDADWNEKDDIRKNEMQLFLKWFIGNGIPKGNDGFHILPQAGDNDFLIKGGANGQPGICLVEGWDARNETDIAYQEQPLFNNNTLAQEWGVTTLPALTLPASGQRTDLVYLDAWEREVNAVEDPGLVNPAINIETCVRLKREWVVRVAEGTSTIPAAVPVGHVFYPLAAIVRRAGQPVIAQADITDLRTTGLSILGEPITIKNNNVGIGVPEPLAKLEVNGSIILSTNQELFITENGQVRSGDNNHRILFRRSENKMELREFGDIILSPGATAGTETAKVVVNASGNVGIGTTEPAAKLHVNGNLNIEAQVNSFDHRLLPLPGDIKRNAFFGNALAASGNQAIVGAYGEDNNTGAGYFFEKNTDGYWAQTQKLQANDKVQLQDFGISVAIDGNYAIIGAPGDSDGGTRAGAAYIYEKNASGTWVQKQKLKASNKQGHHNFGMGVVLNGDLALIGVHGADDVAPDGGVIYCFERRTDGTWIEQTTRLKSTNTRGADYFGTQISMSGARVIVGVPAVDLDSNYSVYDVGAAYIFQKNGTAWEQKLRVQPTGFGKYYFFGAAVCIDGSQAIVGAPANHTESVNKPAAYIYTCDSSGNWSATVTRKLQAEDPNASTGFGCSVAISGNLAVVGAILENAGGT